MSAFWNDLVSGATCLGVAFGAYQLLQARRGLREGFERTFVERCEGIIANIDLGGNS